MLKRLTDGEQISIKMCTACATRLDLCTSALGTATTTEVSTQRTSLTTPHSRSSINGLIAVSPEATFVPPSQTDSDFRSILPTADQVFCVVNDRVCCLFPSPSLYCSCTVYR